MNKLQRDILSILKEHPVYVFVLGFTLLYFLYKGLTYLLIGSYIPLFLISAIVILLIISSHRSKKSFKQMLNIWAILLMIWSVVRLFLILINQFIKPIPESHVAEQLGIFGFILSSIVLFGAVYLLKYKKRIFEE